MDMLEGKTLRLRSGVPVMTVTGAIDPDTGEEMRLPTWMGNLSYHPVIIMCM